MRSHQVLASLALWLTIPLTAAAQERIYYTIGNQIRMSIRGSNTSEILITQGQPTGESPRPAFVAVHDNQLYWTSFYPGNIYRSGLRGENPTQLTRNTDDVTFRAIRFRDNKIYWSNEDDGGIYRANMDGTNVETVISPYLGHGFGIFDFQIYGERFYWTSWNSPSISTTRLDGSDYRRISPAGISRAFALEVLNDRIYIADERTGPQTGRIVSTASTAPTFKRWSKAPTSTPSTTTPAAFSTTTKTTSASGASPSPAALPASNSSTPAATPGSWQ